MDDRQIKQAAENIKEKLHFSGRRKFYFEGSKKDVELDKKIDKEIDNELTRRSLALDNYSLELPKATEQERAEIKLEVIEDMLRQKGFSDNDLKALRDAGTALAEEIIKQREEHLKNDFRVIDGKAEK